MAAAFRWGCEMTETFIRNDLSLVVDETNKINRYIAKSLWSIGTDIKIRELEDFTMSWEEVQQEGGPEAVWAMFEECYKKEAHAPNDEVFIKHKLDVDNDPFKHLITYKVTALYNVKNIEEEYSEIKSRIVEEFVLTWDELDKGKFHHQVCEDLNKKYNII